ncbi:MAG: LysR family transcriptional regulator [Chitinophagales bacterium]|nr:LysR family transcriptional regulator [Chitinophagales bacterium]
MNYTLTQLRVFLKVVEAESVTKAAEELHLTQPAVSIQLKNLQDQFDIPLTEVVGRKIYITDFGREIAASANEILQLAQNIQYKTQAHKGHLTGRLNISVVSTGKYVMPYFLSAFLKQNPGVELRMDVTNKSRVIENLENNEVDFALVSVQPENIAVEKIDLLENRLFLVGGASEKLKKGITAKQIFSELPLIFREQGSATRMTMEKFMDRYHLTYGKKLELTSNEAVKQAVIAGLGMSIMPLIGIKNELTTGQIKIIPVRGLPIKTMWRLNWPKGKKHSPVANAFAEYLREHKNAIVETHFSVLKEYM